MIVCIVYLCARGHEEIAVLEFDFSAMPERGSPETGQVKILAGDVICELRISVLTASDGEAA